MDNSYFLYSDLAEGVVVEKFHMGILNVISGLPAHSWILLPIKSNNFKF